MEQVRVERPPLTGVDRVLKEVLYANVRFPQTEVAIMGFTLNALFTDPDPKKLIEEYLNTDLSEDKIAMMLRAADRAHAAFLNEGDRPKLTADSVQELWKRGKKMVQAFLRNVLEKGEWSRPTNNSDYNQEEEKAHILKLLESEGLPVEDIQKALSAFVKAFNNPEVQGRLVSYRNSFRDRDPDAQDKNEGLAYEIQHAIGDGMRNELRQDTNAPSSAQQKVIDFIDG